MCKRINVSIWIAYHDDVKKCLINANAKYYTVVIINIYTIYIL